MSLTIAALDGSPTSPILLDWALSHATKDDDVLAMLVWNLSAVAGFENPFGNLNQAQLNAVQRVSSIVDSVSRERWESHKSSVPVRIDVRHGDPVTELVKASETADLMVLGGLQRGAASLGSVARGVVANVRCAVTLVPMVPQRAGSQDPLPV